MAAVAAQKMSDEKLKAATGRTRADWHEVLDAVGAREWKHPAIATWLQDEQGVDGWWAQGITVGFEQAIGRRLPGQTADGTFSVSVTKTVNNTRESVVEGVLTMLTDHLGEPSTLSPDSLYATARWKADGHTTVAAIAEPKSGKTIISLTRAKIVDGGTLGAAKAELRKILDNLDASGASGESTTLSK